jgi:hypothetical protein
LLQRKLRGWRIPERGLVVKWSFPGFLRFSARGVIDAPNPMAFLELRPSGNREEEPVLLVCAFPGTQISDEPFWVGAFLYRAQPGLCL